MEKNATKAFYHFSEASESGSVQATYNLGLMFSNGWGTLRSCSDALKHFDSVSLLAPWRSDLEFSVD